MTAHQIGLIFFGWGVCLAITSVFVAPRLQRVFGTLPVVMAVLLLFAGDLVVMALFTDSKTVLVVCVIAAGAFLGVNNTLVTEAVMLAAPVERSTASAAYSFVRFGGGAIAPWLAGKLGESFSPHVPFWVGAVATVLAVAVLSTGRRVLAHLDTDEPAPGSLTEATVLAAADA
jgi:MFS family permease